MSSANLLAEIQLKFLNKRALGTGEPCTCKCVTLPQPLRCIKGTVMQIEKALTNDHLGISKVS